MKLLEKIGREFSGYNILESAKRLKDRKPLQCSLYVTDQCNLDCAYCTEYDNSRPHPNIDDLKKWVRKIRELGMMRIALVGGEPPPEHQDLEKGWVENVWAWGDATRCGGGRATHAP